VRQRFHRNRTSVHGNARVIPDDAVDRNWDRDAVGNVQRLVSRDA
jgi:hypothetical protein